MASPSPAQMREFVKNMYPAPKWRGRVKKMTDAQVMAIYFRKVNEKPKKEEVPV